MDLDLQEDEKYISNGKIYNLTKSELIYSFNKRAKSNVKLMGLDTFVDRERKIYKSKKGNYFMLKDISNHRFSIEDITEDECVAMLKKYNEINILKEVFPEEFEKLEEY